MHRQKRPTLALDSSLVQDNVPVQVVPKLFIGSIHAAFNQDALIDLGITHILNTSRLPSTFPKQFTYLSIDIRDKESANVLSCIPASNIFIEAGIASGGVLVHCFGGRSRSVAFVASFLMCSCGWSFDHVMGIIRAARPVASINLGFESQLRAYAQANYDVYAARQMLIRYRLRALRQYRVLDPSMMGEFASSSNNSNAASLILNAIDSSSQGKTADSPILSANGRISSDYGETDLSSHNSASGHKRSWDDRKSCDNSVEDDSFVEGGDDDKNSLYRFDNDQERDEGSAKRGTLLREQTSCDRPVDTIAHADSKSSRGGSSSSSSSSSSSAQLVAKIPTIDAKTPHCRLSRPSRQSVRVIPPLRGLDNGFCCSWCGFGLFYLANVIRVDRETARLIDATARAGDKGCGDYYYSGSSAAADALMGDDSNMAHSPKGSVGFRSTSSSSLSVRNTMTISTAGGSGGGVSTSTSMGPPTPRTPTTPMAKKSFDRGEGAKDPLGSSSSSSTYVDIDSRSVPMDVESLVASPKVPSPPKTSRGASLKCFDFDDFYDSNSSTTAAARGEGTFAHSPISSSSSSHNSFIMTAAPLSPLPAGRGVVVPSIRIGSGTDTKSTPSSADIASSLSRRNSHDSTGAGSARSLASLDDSPRIAIPPHRSIGIMGMSGDWSAAFDRPQSVERRRWLERVSLLQDSALERDLPVSRDVRVAKLAEDDDDASLLAIGKGKYIHLEYMSWMGTDILRKHIDMGDIRCPNPSCQKTIGSYNWSPSAQQSADGLLDSPIIRVHKSVVHLGTFLLDVTPNATPRPEN